MITLENETVSTETPTEDVQAILEQETPKDFCDYFEEGCISTKILQALSEMKFVKPSEIQKEAIPHILNGEDIIAMAPTGSGKTATFAIPIIQRTLTDDTNIQTLILCPTRELTIQCHKEFEKMGKYVENLAAVSIYGGQNIDRQLNALKRNPQIVIATPGRLMDHLNRGSISLSKVNTVVLDEADEMLDMGFRDDIYSILDNTLETRQTILFSATMAKDILELTNKIQKTPLIIDVTDSLLNTPNIEQQYFETTEKNKIELLIRLLQLHNLDVSLIFCNTKSNVDTVVEKLKLKGFFADAIHGDMNQNQREKVMHGFRKGSVKILVATDVAGRGIDVKNIQAVFNYDLPRDNEDYIHRIGRTGRAGKAGISFTFVSKRQVSVLKKIEKSNGIKINKKDVPDIQSIEAAKLSNLYAKINDIIKNDDLDSYKSDIKTLLTDNIEVLDIAAALLKYTSKKENKKVNKDFIFEEPTKEEETKSFKKNRNGNFKNRRKNNKKMFEDENLIKSKFKKDMRSKRTSKRGK